jgi:hypothetical protein
MKISKNLITQLVSLLLLAFTFSGLDVKPDETAETIVNYLSNGQFYALLLYVMINLVNVFVHWYKTLKENPGKFWCFTESVNFWVAAANILLGVVLLKWGIQIDPEAVKSFIGLIFSKEYWEAGTVLIINILIPLLKIIIKPKDRK